MIATPDPKTVREIAQTAGRLIVERLVSDHIVHKAMAQHFIGHDNAHAWSETYDRVLDELAAVLKPLTQPAEQPQDDGDVHRGDEAKDCPACSAVRHQVQDDDDVRAVAALMVERDEARELACVSLDILRNVSDEPMRELYGVDDMDEMPEWFTRYGKPSAAALEARNAEAPAKHTPEQWCEQYGVDIADPDGWRGKNDPPWDEPITLADFLRRARQSTARNVPDVDWQRIARDAKAGEQR